MDPMQFRLQEAAVQREIGGLYASAAASASSRISLQDSLKTALDGTGLRMPSQITDEGVLSKERDDAIKAAEAAYKDADGLLEAIDQALTSQDLKTTAQLSRAINYYEWAQLARLEGKTEDAKKYLASARTQRDQAAERNPAIPAMPTELGPVPKPQPATEEAPATQPAA